MDTVTPTAVTTSTALPLGPIYGGVELADNAFQRLGTVKGVAGGRIALAGPMSGAAAVKPRDKVWLVNVAVGDTCELPGVLYWDVGRD